MASQYAKLGSESYHDGPLDGPLEQQSWMLDTSRRNQTAARKFIAVTKALRWPAALTLLVAILACEVLSIRRREPQSARLMGDLAGIVPEFSHQHVLFREDASFTSDHETEASTNATEAAWLSLVPRGNGFIDVPDWETYALPDPVRPPNLPGKDTYSLAVFHQMHCLYQMMRYIDDLVISIRSNETVKFDSFWHVNHCFNYLRNTIKCAGDTTLEGQSLTSKHAGTDGTGAVHVCKNFDEIYAWAERNRVTDLKEA